MIKGKVKVDSCRLSIPLIDCEILDTSLIDRIYTQTVNTETSEVLSEVYKNGTPTKLENPDGTYLKFWKESQFFYSNGKQISTLYITFLVNSKHLEKRYFEGISLETLPLIYDYIMSFNVVKFSYDSLLKSRYNDTDICIDFKSTPENFGCLTNNVKKITLKPQHWHTATNQKNNSGIWTPTKDKPRDNAKPTTPFVKFYSKEEDFTYNSINFASKYINPSEYKDLYRLEVTVKNAEHKKHLNISHCKEFGQFLKLDLQLIMQQIVKEYFTENKRIILSNSEISPTDEVLINLMNALTDKGVTNSQLFEYFDIKTVNRPARKRLLEKFYKLTTMETFNSKQLELNSTTKEILSFLNIDVEK